MLQLMYTTYNNKHSYRTHQPAYVTNKIKDMEPTITTRQYT